VVEIVFLRSWRDGEGSDHTQKIAPFLWFDDNAEAGRD